MIRTRFSRYQTPVIVWLFLFGVLVTANSLQSQTLQIDAKTADWLEGFADFMRLENDETPNEVTIGIIGSSEVAVYLIRRANARTSTKNITVVQLSANDSFEGIDIIFAGSSQKENWPMIAQKCCKLQILSIGAQDGFVSQGGCVEFVVRKNNLRFGIDPENAKRCSVQINSKLLELSVEVRK